MFNNLTSLYNSYYSNSWDSLFIDRNSLLISISSDGVVLLSVGVIPVDNEEIEWRISFHLEFLHTISGLSTDSSWSFNNSISCCESVHVVIHGWSSAASSSLSCVLVVEGDDQVLVDS